MKLSLRPHLMALLMLLHCMLKRLSERMLSRRSFQFHRKVKMKLLLRMHLAITLVFLIDSKVAAVSATIESCLFCFLSLCSITICEVL